jgi:Type II secretion system (T2SS), protein E, N-terminal domain
MEKKETFTDRLADVLVKQGVVSQDEIEEIKRLFDEHDEDFFDVFLVDEGLVPEDKMLKALAACYDVASFDVKGYFFDLHLLHKFPKSLMLRYNFIPLEDDESLMIIVTGDPSNPDLLPVIGKNVSYDIQCYVGLRTDIDEAIKEFYDTALTVGVAPDLFDLPDVHDKDLADLETAEEADEQYIPYETFDDDDDNF